jgi:hypothetical protein
MSSILEASATTAQRADGEGAESSRGGRTTALGRIGPRSGCKGHRGGDAQYIDALRPIATIFSIRRTGIVSSTLC